MASDYLTLESEEVRTVLALIDQAAGALRAAESACRPAAGTERYLTGGEVCDLLHISPRTLQTLRDRRQIPFSVVSERNILYPESAIRELFSRHYRPARDPK